MSPVFAARCVFHQHTQIVYACRLENALLLNRHDGFTISGDHMQGRTDQDVTFLFTVNSTLVFVPLQIFDQFPRLTSIELVGVGLRELHLPWRNCNNLASIRLENNNIRTFPAGIFEPCDVKTSIILIRCQIQEIYPMAFRGLSHLQYLGIEWNNISYIHPDTFAPLRNLHFLHLNSAGLNKLHPDTFSPLQNLLMISLSSNRFSTLQPGTFNNLPALQTIRMENNLQLATIESSAFGQLRNLHTIQMQNGSLTRLSTDSFSQLPSLQRLELRSQRLIQIQRNFLVNFPNIEALDVRENVCVDRSFVLSPNEDDSLVRSALEECFSRFEGVTTTLGSSTTTSSFRLIVFLLVLGILGNQIKLK